MGDVARLAGVSPQTVSRVVNAHDYVGGETRERVDLRVSGRRKQGILREGAGGAEEGDSRCHGRGRLRRGARRLARHAR